MTASGSQPRATAARILDGVLHHGRSLRTELARTLPSLEDPRDRALVEALCFAVLRHRVRFEAAIANWIPRPPGKRDNELRLLLYVGMAQLDPLGLPSHAAVAATVEAARTLGRAHQAGLVNAVLRRAQREGLPAADPAANWPAWLQARLREDWPDDHARIFEASAQPPPSWLRVNLRRQSRAEYLRQLDGAGLQAEADAHAPEALRLEGSVPVSALPGFAGGAASVQDISAQRVADALAPPAGSRVFDACAAPGGKSAHLLERDPSLRLTALDVEPARLERVRETFARLGVGDNARLRAADAIALEQWWDGEPFDAVLIDAPCSATGIVRRQPDVLLHRRESDLRPLLETQARLLDALWQVLKPGGVLLYATCSILRAENDAQVSAFLARTADAAAESLGDDFGRAVVLPRGAVTRQRLPGEGGGDGFYYARLRKAG